MDPKEIARQAAAEVLKNPAMNGRGEARFILTAAMVVRYGVACAERAADYAKRDADRFWGEQMKHEYQRGFEAGQDGL